MAERMIELVGNEVRKVAYSGVRGKIAIYDEGDELPTPPQGTVFAQKATLLLDVTTFDGEKLPGLQDMIAEIGPRVFVRGRVVTDQKEVAALLMPPFLRELVSHLRDLVEVETAMEGNVPRVVAVAQSDGTEVGIPLGDKDTAPPEGASPYPVGESPEEVAEAADAKADAEWEEDFDDEADARDEYGLTKADYAVGATVGTCPICLQTHGLQLGVVGLTEEQAAAERERREVEEIREDAKNGVFDGEEVVPAVAEIGGEA